MTHFLPLSVECRKFIICTSFSLPVNHFRTWYRTALRLLFPVAVPDISLHRYAAVSEYRFLCREARWQCNWIYLGKTVIVEPPVVKFRCSASYMICEPVTASLIISYLSRKSKSAVFHGKFQPVIGHDPEPAFNAAGVGKYTACVSAVYSRAFLNFKIGTAGYVTCSRFAYKKYYKAQEKPYRNTHRRYQKSYRNKISGAPVSCLKYQRHKAEKRRQGEHRTYCRAGFSARFAVSFCIGVKKILRTRTSFKTNICLY